MAKLTEIPTANVSVTHPLKRALISRRAAPNPHQVIVGLLRDGSYKAAVVHGATGLFIDVSERCETDKDALLMLLDQTCDRIGRLNAPERRASLDLEED